MDLWGARLPNPESLPLEAQVAQMIVVRASGHLFDHQIRYPAWEPPTATLQHYVQTLGVGGVILLGGSAAELAARSHQLQEWAKIPLLLAADIEEGVGQRFGGATWFPPPMALGALAKTDEAQAIAAAEQMGGAIAQEALAVGLNWVLAPVVDVNNNPQNPVINVRAFGETPEQVEKLAQAFIRGAQSHAVLTTAKHFPGHGDTAVDSHLELPVLPHDRHRLETVELKPFAGAIAAGVDAVMTAHLQIPALDPDWPATLSHRILTKELRDRLGFDGLIVTDALIMGAMERYGPEEGPVQAIEAGADILLMPVDPERTIAAVCEAVRCGRIAPERIAASVERIWRAKLKVSPPLLEVADTSHAWENLPPPQQDWAGPLLQLAQPATQDLAAEILRSSMVVSGPVPLDLAAGDRRNVIVVDDLLEAHYLGHQTPAIARPKALGYSLQLCDRHSFAEGLACRTDTPAPTLLQLFIRGNPFRGSAGTSHMAQAWFQHLLRTQQLEALVIYGSPYVLAQFRPALQGIPTIFTYGQMPLAQAIALDQLFGVAAKASTDKKFTT